MQIIYICTTEKLNSMATVKAYIRTTRRKADSVSIRFRLSDGRSVQLHHVSEINVNPGHWDEDRQEIKSRVLVSDDYRNEINNSVVNRKKLLLTVYDEVRNDPNPERWYKAIDKKLNPEKYKPIEKTFFDIFDDFIKTQEGREVYLKVLRRCLQRWEMYRMATEDATFKIDIKRLNAKDIQAFNKFLQIEHSLQDDYPEIYETVKETRRVKPRGNNARSDHLNKFRSFYKWAVKTKHTTNNPFDEYKVPQEVYGTPYYITINEREKLLKTDLSAHPETAIQRDIFGFQCLIGCRVCDLTKLTKANLKDGDNFIEYIAKKTIEDNPTTVRVPLTETAKMLIQKYDGVDKRGRLFPFISDQKYNVQIKKAFTLAGLDRLVTVLNPTTGEEEQRPLNEVASSHLARRAFIGNIYRKVKDPNLIASMSGHVDGSRAFSRYRTIDDEMKKETINLLES